MTTTKLFGLSGNVAVITGGNGGIGRSIAIGLAEAGASVAIFGRNEEKNKKTLYRIKGNRNSCNGYASRYHESFCIRTSN